MSMSCGSPSRPTCASRRRRRNRAWSRPRSPTSAALVTSISAPLDFAGLHHRAQILHAVGDAERGWPRVAPFEHRDNHVGAVFQRRIGAIGVDEQVEQPLRLPAHLPRDGESLAIGLPRHHQRQVDRELHRCAGADRTAVFEPPAELIEDRLGALGVSGLRAHQAEQFALTRRRGRTANRAFDHRRVLGTHFRRKRERHLRRHRAHFDEQLAFHVARQKTVRPVVDRIDCGRVGQHGDRDFDRTGKLCAGSTPPWRRHPRAPWSFRASGSTP